mmetsp:Transcript_10166/g.26388  ORF Transcript_10166/g.26388 Transcript_10166/m.26388 type:complete len:175 (-) Transcript_10166:281-805(-)|eukprot:CAMPEP_0119405898 /NCGR_PEP_ID=MMETSP1335-20130426/429_1 /TAXON_ID=259385 /ORGANISM="Chrysoculter rhomboideus, Strain RCC1486" /LENGTH=174 /DNA_ID=CAMNT_0007429945 /DNA_START=80 /DNA_END=604 /DNA_ORIENTATION=+
MALALAGKLSIVLVKQVSKPIASFVKREAKLHPVLAPPLAWAGSVFYRTNINLTRFVTGQGWLSRGSIQTIAPITQEKATDIGAELLGESIVFSIVGATVAYEVSRQNRAKAKEIERAKENERQQWEAFRRAADEREALRHELMELREEIKRIQLPTTPPARPSGIKSRWSWWW